MSKKIVQLVENNKRRAMLESKPRYDVVINGVVCGELYFNMTGYNGYLPQSHGVVLDVGEGAISRYKKELPRINAEWAAKGTVNYYKITLNKKQLGENPTASDIDYANFINTRWFVTSEKMADFTKEVPTLALAAERLTADEVPLVVNVEPVDEPTYWKGKLVSTS